MARQRASEIRTKVVGVSKPNLDGVDRQEIIRRHARAGAAVELAREPGHPLDPNAIAVWLTARRLQVGYLSAELAEELAPRLDAGEGFRATILDAPIVRRLRGTGVYSRMIDYAAESIRAVIWMMGVGVAVMTAHAAKLEWVWWRCVADGAIASLFVWSLLASRRLARVVLMILRQEDVIPPRADSDPDA